MRRVTAMTGLGLVFCLTGSAQTIEGKKIVGGHGLSMVNTWHLKQYVEEMKRAPLDGILINVNRNEYAADEKWRQVRPHNWFLPPAVTIDDFSIALQELASTDMGQFKHNLLWTCGSRRFPGDWFDDEVWEKIILNNARVFAEVYKRGSFAACWFDVEVGGEPPGGVMTWKGAFREKRHAFDAYVTKTRQRGRELMQALTGVAPDFRLIVSHSYGDVKKMLNGRGAEGLSEINYGLLPAFLDGLLEGCGERGQLIESGEATYGTMTYAGFMAWRKWDQLATRELCRAPQFLAAHYRHANATWVDFEARSEGWRKDDLDKNHFSPERLKHTFHNAMAASDEFVWTYHQNAHWWPNRTIMPCYDRRWSPMNEDRKFVLAEEYLEALAAARTPMSLDWYHRRTNEKPGATPPFDAGRAFTELGGRYQEILPLDDGWVFHMADSTTASAFGWGIPMNTWGVRLMQVYDWRPIEIGDVWENQGVPLDGGGVYRRRFELPVSAGTKRIYLALGGVAGKATVYVASQGAHAKSVGRTEGESLALFDITEAVDFTGTNDLTIVVASESGPGGIYGAVRILGADKGKDGYIELRGTETGKWFQWIRDRRLGNLDRIASENTVEARIRVPDDMPLTAILYCSTEDGGWSIRLQPRDLHFAGKWHGHTASSWHTYRVVTARAGDKYCQTLFIDGKEFLREHVSPVPVDPAKPRPPALGFGESWGHEQTAPIKMDVDYVRWANRPFTPEDERIAAANVPEAEKRKDVFWDGVYDGDTLPDAEGWKWWYEFDPRPFSKIVYTRARVDLSDPTRLLTFYDWQAGKGARMVPRDVPRLHAADEIQATVEPADVRVGDDTFSTKLVIAAATQIGYSWPAITFTDMAVSDWSSYAAVAIRVHNPTDAVQNLGFSVRDGDRALWHRLEEFAPGETRVLSVTTEELSAKVLLTDVWSLTLWTLESKAPETFLVSPVFLVRK